MYTTTTFIGDNDQYPLGPTKRASVPKDFIYKHTAKAAEFAVIKPIAVEEKKEDKPAVIEEKETALSEPIVEPAQEVKDVQTTEKKTRKIRGKKAPKNTTDGTEDQSSTAE